MQNTVKVTKDISPQLLRQVDQSRVGEMFRILVVDDPQIMRGTDFRAPSTGIALVMSRGLESERDVQQALGRVGRFGEKCVRYSVENVQLVDEDQHIKFRKKLIDFLDSQIEPAPPTSRGKPCDTSSKTRAQKMIETANSLPK